ncbi:hypothetical protein, partial [Mesorhizobium sp.]|uniref:hypothetical protein n=1 Tax=Mesorhizobium sp. TaxID=1871066 RepID=UPI00257F5DC7
AEDADGNFGAIGDKDLRNFPHQYRTSRTSVVAACGLKKVCDATERIKSAARAVLLPAYFLSKPHLKVHFQVRFGRATWIVAR